MAQAPTAALDLPPKAVVFKDDMGKVWVTYNSATYLSQKFGLPSELAKPIENVDALIEAAVK